MATNTVNYNGRSITRIESTNIIQYHTIGANYGDRMTDWDASYAFDDEGIVIESVKTNYYDKPYENEVSSIDYYIDDGTENGKRIANFNPTMSTLVIFK